MLLATPIAIAGKCDPATGAWCFATLVHKDGATIKVVASLSGEPQYFLTSEGVKVQHFMPEDAVKIADAFQEAGLGDDPALAKTVIGMVGARNRVPGGAVPNQHSTEALCLTLRMPDGAMIHVDDRNHKTDVNPISAAKERFLLNPATGDRTVHWPVEHAMLIKKTLLDAGYTMQDVMKVWVGMKWTPPQPVGVSTDRLNVVMKDLDPGCGTCANGIWNVHTQSCTQSGTKWNCTVCGVCL